jgi:hypothetical protein
MVERWTGGMYPATLHRVVHRSSAYRVSVPFFFEPNFDAEVSVLRAAERKWKEDGEGINDMRGLGGTVTDVNGRSTVDGVPSNATAKRSAVYGQFLLDKVGGNFRY